MNTLPDLPFELMLNHLDLKQLIRSRAVSRCWLKRIDRFRVKSVCFSEWEMYYILDKYRRISGKFSTKNYISSSSFQAFFDRFAGSILRNLKHLRILALGIDHGSSNFIEKLGSLQRLETLDIIAVHCLQGDLRLALPNLRSLHLEEVPGHATLTVKAPKLSKIKVWDASFRLIVVHAESVERAAIKNDQNLNVERLSNLKVFHCERLLEVDGAFLTRLCCLNEIHFVGHQAVLSALHDQKKRYNRTDLKIFYHGLCLDKPGHYAGLPNYLTLSDALVDRMIENSSRLSEELAFYEWIYYYSNIEHAVPKVPAGFWKKFTGLRSIDVREVESVERFLDFLKYFDNIVELSFRHQQPQALFDQLPLHCSSLQVLQMENDANLEFLFEFKHLFSLTITNQIGGEFVRKVFRSKRMQNFNFYFKGRRFNVSLNEQKQFYVFNCVHNKICSDLDELVRYVSSHGR